MDEDSDLVRSKLSEFIRNKNILYGKVQVRPYGPYDLAMQSSNGTFFTNQTFGYGYTTEQAACVALWRFTQTAHNAQLEQWLGKGVYSELMQLVADLKKVDEIKTEVVTEKIEQELNVSEHLREPENGV